MNNHFPIKTTSEVIGTTEKLCIVLGISRQELDDLLNTPSESRYTQKKIFKTNGAARIVYNPGPVIRKIQRRIKNRIFDQIIEYPNYLYGSITTDNQQNPRDYINCAKQHCQADSVLKIDISNYFDSITYDIVFDIFKNFFSYPTDVSDILSDICTRLDRVPQGASTSSHIANLCFYSTEGILYRSFKRQKLTYTRLVDDITISTKRENFDWGSTELSVRKMMTDKSLTINEGKTGVTRLSTKAITVHGLRISHKEPRLPKDEVKRLRSAVQDLEKKASKPNARVNFEYRRLFEKVSGRINKLKRLGHNRYENLRRRVSLIRSLPSKKDIKRAVLIVERLERDFQIKNNTFWYKKRFYRAHNRLNILQLIYSSTAADLRSRLKNIEPTYNE